MCPSSAPRPCSASAIAVSVALSSAGWTAVSSGQQVAEHLLRLERALGAVLGDHVAGLDRRTGIRRGLERDVLLTEDRLGQDLRRDVLRDLAHHARVEGEGHADAFAVRVGARVAGGDIDVADLADDQPAFLDVGRSLQLVAGVIGLERHEHDGRELLLVDRDRQPDQRPDHHQVPDAERTAAHDARERFLGHGYPANLTLTVEPQIARDRKKSMMLMITIALRTARPTATPTPAGPPVAL